MLLLTHSASCLRSSQWQMCESQPGVRVLVQRWTHSRPSPTFALVSALLDFGCRFEKLNLAEQGLGQQYTHNL